MNELPKIEDFLVQTDEPEEFSELLHRRGFNVNMRLYNDNDFYRAMITGCMEYLVKSLKQRYQYFNPAGISGHNCGIPFNLVAYFSSGRGSDIHHMINPKIISKSKETTISSSGCGSIAGHKTIRTKRARSIEVEYYDMEGTKNIKEFNGFKSRILQHEIDHNNGILMSDIATKEPTNMFPKLKT